VKIDAQGRVHGLASELPNLRAEAPLELRIPLTALADFGERRTWLREKKTLLLPKGERLLARVRPNDIPAHLRSGVIRDVKTPDRGISFVEIELSESLYLLSRPTGIAKLSPSDCRIPSLRRDAASVNEAYRIISEAFEPGRRAHSANVFLEVFYQDDSWWLPLDAYRVWLLSGHPPLRGEQR
jgi:hypothetical protein